MATIVDQALVLRQWDFSETSQTVVLLGRSHGLIRGLAKGARRERSSFSGGFEVMTAGEVVAILKSGSDLAALTEWDLQEVFWGPRRSWRAHLAGLYVVDILRHVLIEADPHPTLFDAACSALRGFDLEIDATVARFQWAALSECGYQPRVAIDGRDELLKAATYEFSPQAGGLTPDRGADGPGSSWRVRRATVQVVQALAEGISLEQFPNQDVARASRLLAGYLSAVCGLEIPSEGSLFMGQPPAGGGRSRMSGGVR